MRGVAACLKIDNNKKKKKKITEKKSFLLTPIKATFSTSKLEVAVFLSFFQGWPNFF
jgi:hypothetical protein